MRVTRVRLTFNAANSRLRLFLHRCRKESVYIEAFPVGTKKWVTMGLLDKIRAFFSGGSKEEVISGDGTAREGTVTYFNWSKGYGFIETKDIQGRIFLHRSKLRGRVKVGDQVRFELAENKRGLFAKRILD